MGLTRIWHSWTPHPHADPAKCAAHPFFMFFLFGSPRQLPFSTKFFFRVLNNQNADKPRNKTAPISRKSRNFVSLASDFILQSQDVNLHPFRQATTKVNFSQVLFVWMSLLDLFKALFNIFTIMNALGRRPTGFFYPHSLRPCVNELSTLR